MNLIVINYLFVIFLTIDEQGSVRTPDEKESDLAGSYRPRHRQEEEEQEDEQEEEGEEKKEEEQEEEGEEESEDEGKSVLCQNQENLFEIAMLRIVMG